MRIVWGMCVRSFYILFFYKIYIYMYGVYIWPSFLFLVLSTQFRIDALNPRVLGP